MSKGPNELRELRQRIVATRSRLSYLSWRNPEAIARDYGIADHSSVYRHVHAMGLRDKRLSPVRAALESIIERAADAQHIIGDTIIRAVWAYAHITDTGQSVDPPKAKKSSDMNRRSRQMLIANRVKQKFPNPLKTKERNKP